ncbi:hypothetical protein GQ464_012165 [Rhodocaloribacter litoris]|uniref:hypothetical protein n=1 Tax=Rhodocaloribacter litoris TaxID=2558931 RepID=UPI00141FA794|nr:hypothetical protein [Rhodocaloribacter litoris]QXD14204.1 hypothetical protein GQ464_012165 [Rhodocaloribacter litoris]
MYSSAYHHKIVLLTSSFQYPPRRLLFGRARLYLDRIELTGWHVGEKFHALIPLDEVCRIEWHLEGGAGPNAVFHLEDGRVIELVLKQGSLWKHTLEERMRWSSPGRYRLAPARPPVDLPLSELITYSTGMG